MIFAYPLLATLLAVSLAACSAATQDTALSADPGLDAIAGEPPLETSPDQLAKALQCTDYTHPDKPPVLLVHGTFTAGFEQYEWTYIPLLVERGFDVCTITYPDRGFGDMQISAEYVVYALRRMRAESGRKVAMIGHSQGALMPRWALKFWPSARNAVSDFVLQAGPNHGTTVGSAFFVLPFTVGQPESIYQFDPDSQFVTTVNQGDETPGDIDYSNLYTQFDELVQPVTPIPTAALDWQANNPKVANILLQDLCAGRFVDHVTIGLTDRLAFELTLDAISNPGPANIERAGGAALCGLAAIVPDQITSPAAATALTSILQQEIGNGAPALHLVAQEPPLKPYAR